MDRALKLFEMRQLREALAHAAAGGQALHLHPFSQGHPLFSRYKEIAHLFDQNRARLISTARQLGVKVVKIERSGEPGQHVDLCGKPLELARVHAGEVQVVPVNSPLDLFLVLTDPPPAPLH